VDDDDINRWGMACLLQRVPGIDVVAALRHPEARTWPGPWSAVDVLLVDAADERAEGDQFPGVAVVEHVRRQGLPSQPRVVVITGHLFDAAVRRRMREARADFFYHRGEVADAEALAGAVLRPTARPLAAAEPDAERRLGVTPVTRVNRAVRYAVDNGLETLLADRPQPASRAWLRLRRDFNRVAGLTPVTSDGRRPDRVQKLPSLPQIARFLGWATRVKDRASGAADR
jgi:hypothetical protein